MIQHDKDKIKLTDILNSLDFKYIINDNDTLSLRDLQGANLANIENIHFEIDKDIAIRVIERLDTYIYDYYISFYIDTLWNECQEYINALDYKNILAKMKMYPDIFKECINLMEVFVNPRLFDISDILENKKIKIKCFRCGTRLMKSPIEGYTYFCPECYEDFYEFEQGKEN